MCLILFAWQAHPHYPLVVAANRDEFHDRPTAPAEFWQESPSILAGRDIQAGGTWMGVSRNGRFAAISNYREPLFKTSKTEYSRGHLVRDFLLGDSAPASHAEHLQTRGADYRGFNLLIGDTDTLLYLSNRTQRPACVNAGIHGLSNHLLDTDWPKVNFGRTQLETILKHGDVNPEALLELLADRGTKPPTSLAAEELQSEPESMTKRIFIDSPVYGTRSSTVLLVSQSGEISFIERQFDTSGTPIGTRSHNYKISS